MRLFVSKKSVRLWHMAHGIIMPLVHMTHGTQNPAGPWPATPILRTCLMPRWSARGHLFVCCLVSQLTTAPQESGLSTTPDWDQPHAIIGPWCVHHRRCRCRCVVGLEVAKSGLRQSSSLSATAAVLAARSSSWSSVWLLGHSCLFASVSTNSSTIVAASWSVISVSKE